MPPERFPGLCATPPHPNGSLLWDGACGFCARSVEWLHRAARAPVHTTPVQPHLDSLPEPARRTAAQQVLWISPQGDILGGVRAVAAALHVARRPRLARLLIHPLLYPAARLAYRAAARFRHRLPGDRSGRSCARLL